MTGFEFDLREKLMEQERNVEKAQSFIADHIGELLEFSEMWFGATVCMLLEEYCKAKKIDMPEYSTKIFEAIIDVNEKYGRY